MLLAKLSNVQLGITILEIGPVDWCVKWRADLLNVIAHLFIFNNVVVPHIARKSLVTSIKENLLQEQRKYKNITFLRLF